MRLLRRYWPEVVGAAIAIAALWLLSCHPHRPAAAQPVAKATPCNCPESVISDAAIELGKCRLELAAKEPQRVRTVTVQAPVKQCAKNPPKIESVRMVKCGDMMCVDLTASVKVAQNILQMQQWVADVQKCEEGK